MDPNGNVPINDLSLSPRLKAELDRWAKDFDATTPKGTRMKREDFTPTDWAERGLRLARELQAEVRETFEVVLRP